MLRFRAANSREVAARPLFGKLEDADTSDKCRSRKLAYGATP